MRTVKRLEIFVQSILGAGMLLLNLRCDARSPPSVMTRLYRGCTAAARNKFIGLVQSLGGSLAGSASLKMAFMLFVVPRSLEASKPRSHQVS
jgi:hypothetical protein